MAAEKPGQGGPSDFERMAAASSLMRTVWDDPASIIEVHKKLLAERGETMVERLADCPLPVRLTTSLPITEEQLAFLGINTGGGTFSIETSRDAMFRMYVYGDKTTGEEHVAVIRDVGDGENVPLRIHSSCLTAETFHASNCECHEQLELALSIADREGYGGVIWLHQEGRGNGLTAKARQLTLMVEQGLDTVQAFEAAGYQSERRDFTPAVEILKDLGIKSVRLITNNPSKIAQAQALGIVVTERIPCEIPPANDMIRKDLQAKRDRHGHMIGEDI